MNKYFIIAYLALMMTLLLFQILILALPPLVSLLEATIENYQDEMLSRGTEMSPRAEPIRLYFVAHSHTDPGWIESFDHYYDTQV
jgi:hypothetical protein